MNIWRRVLRDAQPARAADSARRPTARFTIVGVVGTINSIDLGEPVTKERLYYPAAQVGPGSMALVLKTGARSADARLGRSCRGPIDRS